MFALRTTVKEVTFNSISSSESFLLQEEKCAIVTVTQLEQLSSSHFVGDCPVAVTENTVSVNKETLSNALLFTVSSF